VNARLDRHGCVWGERMASAEVGKPGKPGSLRDWFVDRLKIVVEGPRDSVEASKDLASSALAPQLPPNIHVENLQAASKWAAAGFSAVTGLLLFFGVKEGVLDQAIRRDPFATLCVFMLLGVGVLSALFTGAIDQSVRMRLWAVLAAIAVMLFLTALFLPNLDIGRDVEDLLEEGFINHLWSWVKKAFFFISGLIVAGAAVALPLFFVRYRQTKKLWDRVAWIISALVLGAAVIIAFLNARLQTRLSVATGALLLIAIAWSFAQRITLPAAAAVIILGVAATSLGLYGAAKLSVGSKTFAIDPQISASLEQAEGRTDLRIVAVASRMSGEKLLITVVGAPRIQEAQPRDVMGAYGEIWQSMLEPNAIDEIDASLTVPLSPTRWEFVTVRHCRVNERRLNEEIERCNKEKGGSLDLRLRNLMPEAGAEINGNIVAASRKSLKASLAGRNVAWGTQVYAEICRVGKDGHTQQLAYATLTPDANGSMAWEVPVSAGADGEGLVLQYRQCPRGAFCPDRMTQLAKYVLP
jgi:hypothetical protein